MTLLYLQGFAKLDLLAPSTQKECAVATICFDDLASGGEPLFVPRSQDDVESHRGTSPHQPAQLRGKAAKRKECTVAIQWLLSGIRAVCVCAPFTAMSAPSSIRLQQQQQQKHILCWPDLGIYVHMRR